MRRAFTLIELLIVIAIIGILLAFSAVAMQKARVMATNLDCQNHMKNLGSACLLFEHKYNYYPRSTVRPRGVTAINAEPAGNLNRWDNGSFESWPRQLAPFFEGSNSRTQDAVPVLGCPADPRGPTYSIPTYGFTWYVGVYSNPNYINDGILVDDSFLHDPLRISKMQITDGTGNTILFAERPPSADGLLGWWDSPWTGDAIAPARGDRHPVSSSRFGNCPNIATYRYGNYQDNCFYNSVWSNHLSGGNVCYADNSVRMFSYAAGNLSVGGKSVIEALASRSGEEVVNVDY